MYLILLCSVPSVCAQLHTYIGLILVGERRRRGRGRVGWRSEEEEEESLGGQVDFGFQWRVRER